jgi:hypothetical protein
MFAGSAILLEVLTIIRVGQELHLERLRGMTKEQAARYWAARGAGRTAGRDPAWRDPEASRGDETLMR